jgi:hypothetical protein
VTLRAKLQSAWSVCTARSDVWRPVAKVCFGPLCRRASSTETRGQHLVRHNEHLKVHLDISHDARLSDRRCSASGRLKYRRNDGSLELFRHGTHPALYAAGGSGGGSPSSRRFGSAWSDKLRKVHSPISDKPHDDRRPAVERCVPDRRRSARCVCPRRLLVMRGAARGTWRELRRDSTTPPS